MTATTNPMGSTAAPGLDPLGADVDPRAWTVGLRLARYYPSRYLFGGGMWAANHTLPVIVGLVLKALFDRVAEGSAPGDMALGLVAAVAAAEMVHAAVLASAFVIWPAWTHTMEGLIRFNLLRSILRDRRPPSVRLPGSAAEAVGRFREDVNDLVWFVDVWVDVAGGIVFTGLALVVMGSIDMRITAVVVLPMVAVVIATRWLSRHIRRLHGATRQAGANVSSLVGELFSNALAVKCGGAEQASLQRLHEENANRSRSAVKVEVAANLIPTASEAAAALTIGFVLLMAAPRMRTGAFTVGDLALFTVYADALTGLPRWIGRMLAKNREAGVSIRRMARLLSEPDPFAIVEHRAIAIRHDPDPAPAPARLGPDDGLVRLEVRGLTYRHPTSGRGIDTADLDIVAGRFTVITGAMGAGKTTLVRTLIGALPAQAGGVTWNGRPLALDELMPPLAAYAGQVPRLFSASLEENLDLGWHASPTDLADALRTVALDTDVAGFPSGLDTVVGPRGARLSGGQQQRTATARALVRRPELLIVDDPSSALDVETEAALWENLAVADATVVAVSHRRAALERADHIVVLDRGRVVGAGGLGDLLDTCPEMARLWREDSSSKEKKQSGRRQAAPSVDGQARTVQDGPMQLSPRYGSKPIIEMDGTSADIKAPFLRQRRRLVETIRAIDAVSLDEASRCEGWSGRDVLLHLTDTDRFWAASISAGRAGQPTMVLATFDPKATPAMLVDAGRTKSLAEAIDDCAIAAENLCSVVESLDDEAWDATAEAPPGHLPIRVVVHHALWDGWVHERDIAIPLGLPLTEDDAEVLACLRYVAALSPAFAVNADPDRAGGYTIVPDDIEGAAVVVTVDGVVIIGSDDPADGRPVMRGPGAELVDALSIRGPLATPLPGDSAWLTAGLAEVFESAT